MSLIRRVGLIFIVLLVEPSWANQCRDVFSRAENDGIVFSPSMSRRSEYTDLSHRINSWLPENLKVRNIDIRDDKGFEEPATDAHFEFSDVSNFFRGILTMKSSYESISQKSRTAIFAHEFGHAIYDLHIKYEVDGRLISKRELFDELEATQNPAQYAKRLNELRTITEDFNNQNYDSLSHGEFFSDLVAVLFMNDPAVMRNTLEELGLPRDHYPTHPNAGRLYRRDFSRTTSFNDWSRSEFRPISLYMQFDPVRAPLLLLLKKHRVGPDEFPLVLSSVLRAIQNHHADIIKMGHLRVSFTRMNKEFFRHIVNALKEDGLISPERH